mmetsp:Transcript_391/g.938  ORF Transcript_391/g.938 Transcript_391/m.938 type:complete len:326 (-) Transcript_391:1077-2054(-)
MRAFLLPLWIIVCFEDGSIYFPNHVLPVVIFIPDRPLRLRLDSDTWSAKRWLFVVETGRCMWNGTVQRITEQWFGHLSKGWQRIQFTMHLYSIIDRFFLLTHSSTPIKPTVQYVQTAVHVSLDDIQCHQNSIGIHVSECICSNLESKRTRMPVPEDGAQTILSWIAIQQLLAISRRIVISISHLLPSKPIQSILLLRVIIMSSKVKPSLDAERIVPIPGISVIQIDILLLISLACIAFPSCHKMMHHWPTLHALSPSYQLLALFFRSLLFEVSPRIVNDICIWRYVVCDAIYLVLMRVSTSSTLSSVLYNEFHIGSLKHRLHRPF